MSISFNTILGIPGYDITEKIYIGSNTVVYRGFTLKDKKPVVIKALREEYPTFDEVNNYQAQYSLIKDLDIPGIVKIHDLITFGNGFAVVMNDFGGTSLRNVIRNHQYEIYLQNNIQDFDAYAAWLEMQKSEFNPSENTEDIIEEIETDSIDLKSLSSRDQTEWDIAFLKESKALFSISDFLFIAIQLASALDLLHHQRIVHKDIKPGNIVINPETLKVEIIDFSISSRLPSGAKSLEIAETLQGTIKYIAPEQTGRVDWGIDPRTDLYCLGVTFFELLAGRLPFDIADPRQLVYCHVAKTAPSVRFYNMGVPSQLSIMISKLIAKRPEDRYQSASGLKDDLERCLAAWKKNGKIPSFEPALTDISDRFVIPNKLFGRESEVGILLETFERVKKGNTELLFVSGPNGIGKTSIVNEAQKLLIQKNCYFIRGQFEEAKQEIPFYGMSQVFGDLVEQVTAETDATIKEWRSKILSTFGDKIDIITHLVPELANIIDPDLNQQDLNQQQTSQPSEIISKSLTYSLLQKLIYIFATTKHPLIIFLDNFQWIDPESLALIKILVEQNDKNNERPTSLTIPFIENIDDSIRISLLIIGGYERKQKHKMYFKTGLIEETQGIGINTNRLEVEELTPTNINDIISQTIHRPKSSTELFTQMVFAKTKGNPRLIHNFLQLLYKEEIIKFNFDVYKWEYEIDRIRNLALSTDIINAMITKMEDFLEETKDVLFLAACLGSQFDFVALCLISKKDPLETSTEVWIALMAGMIISKVEKPYDLDNCRHLFKNNSKEEQSLEFQKSQLVSIMGSLSEVPKFKFIHENIRKTAYSWLDKSEVMAIHLWIGHKLLDNTPVEEREEKIFELVNQFNYAIPLITDIDERYGLAEMNLVAGLKALSFDANLAASEYLLAGIELLTTDSWQTRYQITFDLHEAAIKATYLAGQFAESEQLIQAIINNCSTFLEKNQSYQIQIEIYKAQNKVNDAIEFGLEILKSLSVEIPINPFPEQIYEELGKTKSVLETKDIEKLIELPEMRDPEKKAAMHILWKLLPISFNANQGLFTLIVLKQVNISLNYGNCGVSSLSYATYAILMINIFGDIDLAHKFSELALRILHKFNANALKGAVMFVHNIFLKHWQESFDKISLNLLDISKISLINEDLEHAAYSTYHYSEYLFLQGEELPITEQNLEKAHAQISLFHREIPLQFNYVLWQLVLQLIGQPEKCISIDNPIDNDNENKQIIFYQNFYQLLFYYLVGDYDVAAKYLTKAEEYLDSVSGMTIFIIFHAYSSLTMLATSPNTNTSEQAEILAKVNQNQEKLKRWADRAPMNYLNKYYLVEAEKTRVLGDTIAAMGFYDLAIECAKDYQLVHEEALANELAAKLFFNLGREKITQIYVSDAYYAYSRWGAKVKIDHLIDSYPDILTKIIQREKDQQNAEEQKNLMLNMPRKAIPQKGVLNSVSLARTQSKHVPYSLDLAAMIKISQALYREIELDNLLTTLIEVVKENAGATKCALILTDINGKDFNLAVINSNSIDSTETSILTSFSLTQLESQYDIPSNIINYVKRTNVTWLIDDVMADIRLSSNNCIARCTIKTIICIPVINKGKTIGILYLDNNLSNGVFTRDRVEILKLLISQAAISLENAMLYKNLNDIKEQLEEYSHNLEIKVEERTQEIKDKNLRLEQTLQNLQNTQSQLVQSEKMSGLGKVVAGIAHEINNPINFIHGNTDYVKSYIKDLLGLVNIYRQEYPEPSPIVMEKMAEVDLDFISKDLLGILSSMKAGTSRVSNIIAGLRNFSRLDESDMKQVNIHEGIENTLMILQYRLQEVVEAPDIKQKYSALEVIKEYGEIPPIFCHTALMNQVFIHILSNSIDAIEDAIKDQSLIDEPKISITTEQFNPETIRIRFSDNGCGISPEIKTKIFDPFFTTKPVGKGVGLGLSIAYQIVVDRHNGKLVCNSTPQEGTEFTIEIPIRLHV